MWHVFLSLSRSKLGSFCFDIEKTIEIKAIMVVVKQKITRMEKTCMFLD